MSKDDGTFTYPSLPVGEYYIVSMINCDQDAIWLSTNNDIFLSFAKNVVSQLLVILHYYSWNLSISVIKRKFFQSELFTYFKHILLSKH